MAAKKFAGVRWTAPFSIPAALSTPLSLASSLLLFFFYLNSHIYDRHKFTSSIPKYRIGFSSLSILFIVIFICYFARLKQSPQIYCSVFCCSFSLFAMFLFCLYRFMWFMIKVTFGEHDRCNDSLRPETRFVLRAIAQEFSFTNFDNDIALLRLNDRVPITDFIRPICMPTNAGACRRSKPIFRVRRLFSIIFFPFCFFMCRQMICMWKPRALPPAGAPWRKMANHRVCCKKSKYPFWTMKHASKTPITHRKWSPAIWCVPDIRASARRTPVRWTLSNTPIPYQLWIV